MSGMLLCSAIYASIRQLFMVLLPPFYPPTPQCRATIKLLPNPPKIQRLTFTFIDVNYQDPPPAEELHKPLYRLPFLQ